MCTFYFNIRFLPVRFWKLCGLSVVSGPWATCWTFKCRGWGLKWIPHWWPVVLLPLLLGVQIDVQRCETLHTGSLRPLAARHTDLSSLTSHQEPPRLRHQKNRDNVKRSLITWRFGRAGKWPLRSSNEDQASRPHVAAVHFIFCKNKACVFALEGFVRRYFSVDFLPYGTCARQTDLTNS